MMPKASAWKVPTNGNITYRLQIDGIARGDKKAVHAATEGWKQCGDGWNPSKKTEIIIFERSFDTYYGFQKWKKSFPWELFVDKDTRGRKPKK